ncbi:MAG TPA: ECF-type sigma factor [Terriglobia bacterium]|nr:ECF-type sigma factor [Terriglobia bacterium]
MPGSAPQTLDVLIQKMRNGDEVAAERVFALLYSDLRRKAAYYMRKEAPGHTLQPTALVHEAYLKLFAGKSMDWQDRAHLLAGAARQMRLILVDQARRRKALKRADPAMELALQSEPARRGQQFENVLIVNEALEDLEGPFPRAARVVELKTFGSLTEPEIARALGISVSTVKKDWTFASAWLRRRLRQTDHSGNA